jgi:hypothetical protein
VNPLTPSPSIGVDGQSALEDPGEDDDSHGDSDTVPETSASGHKRGLSSPQVEEGLQRRRFGS